MRLSQRYPPALGCKMGLYPVRSAATLEGGVKTATTPAGRVTGDPYLVHDHGRNPIAWTRCGTPSYRINAPTGRSRQSASQGRCFFSWGTILSACKQASISCARGGVTKPFASRQAVCQTRKLSRLHSQHGLCPAAIAAASSKKNNSV